MLAGAVLLMAASVVIAARGWRSLTKALLAYGYLARVPVTIIMFFAIRGDWGTHYDGPPPNFPPIGWLGEFFLTGVIPQLAIWIAFTVIVGSLLGIAATAIARRKAPAPATT